MATPSVTRSNLNSALSIDSIAHIQYQHFAKIARSEGYEEIAKLFDAAAARELAFALDDIATLIGPANTKECLEMAIESETSEYTQLFPQFAQEAITDNNPAAATKMQDRSANSGTQSALFSQILASTF